MGQLLFTGIGTRTLNLIISHLQNLAHCRFGFFGGVVGFGGFFVHLFLGWFLFEFVVFLFGFFFLWRQVDFFFSSCSCCHF